MVGDKLEDMRSMRRAVPVLLRGKLALRDVSLAGVERAAPLHLDYDR